ncbi:hypothetical protein AMAG_19209 [Allomyces macrogynus ATCC 38327]|uniref:Extracellular metalloproteinase n=1 Tax=Allomyces macrogynus (strain ATCC 38327) TaxID=578462 RepID=A0A0L0STE4_ALLM3|nr:hypothetical protein AMAG_19209 [Allomyces macrogynus ATCC 38327]|eukprot:KNE65776.1 hypothetical protein AMAG_19209 [Allomyces macrogynus ATCC 38327]
MTFSNLSLSEVLDDLGSRFIINVPDEELASIERICFQIEQAHWYYEDFVREENPRLPSFSLKSFWPNPTFASSESPLFKHCPLLHEWAEVHEKAFDDFMKYKFRVPVCGAIVINEDLDQVLLVKGWNSRNWTFPRGKINKGEKELKCACMSGNTVVPNRDGDLENGIVIHEFGHGVSNRLTGGPHNSGCLAWGESGGMGEGWGDVWATIFRHRTADRAHRDYGPWHMGKYANGGSTGIRKYPYSPDVDVNPSTYSFLNHQGYWGVHAKGEVWAAILLEVYWNLIDELGWTTHC